jgi:hypothetical protein
MSLVAMMVQAIEFLKHVQRITRLVNCRSRRNPADVWDAEEMFTSYLSPFVEATTIIWLRNTALSVIPPDYLLLSQRIFRGRFVRVFSVRGWYSRRKHLNSDGISCRRLVPRSRALDQRFQSGPFGRKTIYS